jgi:hypothetical protein
MEKDHCGTGCRNQIRTHQRDLRRKKNEEGEKVYKTGGPSLRQTRVAFCKPGQVRAQLKKRAASGRKTHATR